MKTIMRNTTKKSFFIILDKYFICRLPAEPGKNGFVGYRRLFSFLSSGFNNASCLEHRQEYDSYVTRVPKHPGKKSGKVFPEQVRAGYVFPDKQKLVSLPYSLGVFFRKLANCGFVFVLYLGVGLQQDCESPFVGSV